MAEPVGVVTAQGNEQRRIVVGVDGSDHAARALRWALDEAVIRGATVQAVHAWQYPDAGVTGFPVPEGAMEGIAQSAQEILDHAIDGQMADGVDVERCLVLGPAAHALLDAAKGADLLVIGSRGRGGFAGLLLGSVSQQCAHHAPCPVVIVPGAVTADGETSGKARS